LAEGASALADAFTVNTSVTGLCLYGEIDVQMINAHTYKFIAHTYLQHFTSHTASSLSL
jgi:hypothetical protein